MPLFGRGKKRRTFTLSLTPVMGNVPSGGSATAAISVSPSRREASVVNLSAGLTMEGGGLQSGINISFDPPLGVPFFTSVMNISAAPELTPGAYPFLVIAAGEDMKQMVTYTLIVRAGKSAKEAKKPVLKRTTERQAE